MRLDGIAIEILGRSYVEYGVARHLLSLEDAAQMWMKDKSLRGHSGR